MGAQCGAGRLARGRSLCPARRCVGRGLAGAHQLPAVARRSGALIALACALAPSPAHARPRIKAPGANRTEIATRANATAASTPERRQALASFRVAPGLGGGGSGWAGRLGGEFDYWFSAHAGAGLAAATSVLIYRFEEARSYWLLGPLLALRSNPSESYLHASAAVGWMQWSCAPGPCEDDGETGLAGLGATLKGAYVGRLGAFEIGPSLTLDITRGHAPAAGASVSLTLGLELGFGL